MLTEMNVQDIEKTIKEVYEILSKKEINSETIDERINEIEDRIKSSLPNIFTHSIIGRNTGEDLLLLSNMKIVKDIIQTEPYILYENSGKEISYDIFLRNMIFGL